MRKIISALTVLLSGAAICCTRMPAERPPEPLSEPSPTEFSLLLSAPGDSDTKSQYREADLMTIRNVWVMSLCPDGFWRTDYFTEDALTREGAFVRCPSISYRAGSAVSLFIAANMGDLTDQAFDGGIPAPEQVEYLLPQEVDFAVTAMPMAAQTQIIVPTSMPVQAHLEPLLAKLRVAIDKRGISDNTPAQVLASGELTIKHANRRLRPFGVSTALDSDDLFSMDVDRESFAEAVSYDMTHANLVLYVPENIVDTGTGSDRERCTYITYTCSKNAEDDGVGGDLAINAYLGDYPSQNYSVVRNTTYNCTLNLSWDGLFLDGDWRMDNRDLSDGRILTLSTVPHTGSASFADLGSLRREQATTLYVNFSRDGGATWVPSAKDIDSWPYGWDLYIDGVKQAGGGSASAEGDLGWVYTGATSGDRIAITPGASAVTGESHTVQVKSADGHVVSNVVQFEVGLNALVGSWMDNAAPLYVAQCGQIQCFDPDTQALFTDAVICSTDPSKIKVQDHGNGTADVSILAPFEAGEVGIYLTDPDGERRCDMELEGLLPYWSFNNQSDIDTYVDGMFSKYVIFCKTTATTGAEYVQGLFKLSNGTYATGKYLNYSLILSCLKPAVTSDNGLVGLDSFSYTQNSMQVTMKLKTFNGISFGTETEKVIDAVHVAFRQFDQERGGLEALVSARNPFAEYGSLKAGALLNDYTLYQFPGNDYGWDSSASWSADTFVETGSYTMSVPRVIVDNDTHTRLKAYFHDDGRAFGTAMLSGAPSRYNPSSMTYSLSGLKETDIDHHGAGRVNFNIDVVNPVDGSVLTKTFGYGYVRLHAFIYGEVYWTRYGKFLTAPNIRHGNAKAGRSGLFPSTLSLAVAGSLSAPTWPYITASDGVDSDGELQNMTRAIMEQDDGSGHLALYPELESSVPGWVGRNGRGEECWWYLPENMSHVPGKKQTEFLKACVRRSVLPYTFSTSESSVADSAPLYRKSERELHYDPTWKGTYTYSLPVEIESNAAKRRLLVMHIIKGRTESYSSYLGYYDAAPEGGNGGWYFSYDNRTAFWQ